MNGSRSTYMRKGYLLTALAAAVLLAASSGTAYAQRVTIGFVGTSGEISEKAYLVPNSPEDPQMITVRVQGLRSGARRVGDIGSSLDTVLITANKAVNISTISTTGAFNRIEPIARGGVYTVDVGTPPSADGSDVEPGAHPLLDHADEFVLVVAQSADGAGDTNWLGEKIELKLTVAGTASVSPDIFTLTVAETNVAPVAKFLQPSFTLSEQSARSVELDVAKARGADLPDILVTDSPFTQMISVRVSNHGAVMFAGDTDAECPTRANVADYNKKLFRFVLDDGDWAPTTNFDNTGVLETLRTISDLAGANTADEGAAGLMIEGCGDGAGISDPQITLTIMETNLTGTSATRANGDITIGAPLMVSIDSDEAVPTLSFSPTNVEIDEGGSTSTVLLAEGSNADDVGMVKLSVEGDAMVSLMQDGEMLEEMGGYVYVDLDGNSSARLEAMSHSDPDLMDGDMASKTWKLMEGGTDGADIGEGYWFTVDVRGSTAVPALPLVGQLLLALFLMAGGARLYRRRQG